MYLCVCVFDSLTFVESNPFKKILKVISFDDKHNNKKEKKTIVFNSFFVKISQQKKNNKNKLSCSLNKKMKQFHSAKRSILTRKKKTNVCYKQHGLYFNARNLNPIRTKYH